MWADYGDWISYHYVGTNSTTSKISRGSGRISGMYHKKIIVIFIL